MNTQSIERHDEHLSKLDETCAMLRESYGRVATKDDIMVLSRSINDKFDGQMRDAQNSTPRAVTMLIAAGSLVCTIITVTIALMHH